MWSRWWLVRGLLGTANAIPPIPALTQPQPNFPEPGGVIKSGALSSSSIGVFPACAGRNLLIFHIASVAASGVSDIACARRIAPQRSPRSEKKAGAESPRNHWDPAFPPEEEVVEDAGPQPCCRLARTREEGWGREPEYPEGACAPTRGVEEGEAEAEPLASYRLTQTKSRKV